jgi:hypothetical protein
VRKAFERDAIVNVGAAICGLNRGKITTILCDFLAWAPEGYLTSRDAVARAPFQCFIQHVAPTKVCVLELWNSLPVTTL